MAPNKLAKLMKKEKERLKAAEEADRMTVPETGRRTVPECWDDEPTELCCSVPQGGRTSRCAHRYMLGKIRGVSPINIDIVSI